MIVLCMTNPLEFDWNLFKITHALLALTGVITGSSKKLCQELGLTSLHPCCWYIKLDLIYKILKNEYTQCFSNSISTSTTLYLTRSMYNILHLDKKFNFFELALRKSESFSVFKPNIFNFVPLTLFMIVITQKGLNSLQH